MATFYLFLGSGLFLIQILLFSLFRINLDFLTLVVFYLSRTPFLLATLLVALGLGLLTDCYSGSPLGLHAGALLVVVFLTKIFRFRFNLQSTAPQVLAIMAILVIQGLVMWGLISLLEPMGYGNEDILKASAWRVGTTALMAPPVLVFLAKMEKTWGRYFFRSPTAQP